MKFWQKAYFLTLLIVSATLLVSVTVFVSVTRGNSFAAESEKLLERQHTIAARFAEDAAAVLVRKPEALTRLAETYTDAQKKNNVYLQIKENGKVLASTLPPLAEPLFEIPPAGSRASAVKTSGEHRYYFVGMHLPDGLQGIDMVFAFDIEPFYSQWSNTTGLFILLGAALFVILAIALLIVMRGISKPLEGLARVAESWAQGNYSVKSNNKKRDEVGRLAIILDEMSAKVEQDMAELKSLAEQKQQLVDNLAHELNTPLTAVQGYAEYLQRSRLSADDKIEATDYIITETARLISLSERLLQMASLRDEKARFALIKTDELFESTLRTVSAKARAKSIDIKASAPKGIFVNGERALLESLLINLTDNAIKACKSGGEIKLCAEQKAMFVIISITDNGCGMDEKALQPLGEEFYRPDKARSRENGGAGLGIALCRAIVKAHNAKMNYASAPGKGTSVTIIFSGEN